MLLIPAIIGAILVAILLSVRKRREVIDLTAEEYQYLSKIQEGARPSETDQWPKPVGPPLFSDHDHDPIKVYKNGIQARFVSVDDIQLIRSSTGFQKRYVARYKKVFYPFNRIASIYPISINIVRKMGSGGFRIHNEDLENLGSIINEVMAYADDGPPGAARKDKFSTIQVETTDYRTAILCPSISRGYCDMAAILEALGRAMGPQAKEKVRTKTWLHGFYLILEEPGHYDSESRHHYRGDRNRVMLGDIHKHYVLRSQKGYPQRRRMALETLRMRDIRTLDERLRT
jgi:hypothetical protein